MNRLSRPYSFSASPASSPAYLPSGMESTILFRVTEADIEIQSTERLRALLDPRIRGFAGIEHLIGSVDIILPDSEARHSEPFLCPTLRRYCETLNEQFPFWGSFFSCQSKALWNMTLCLVQNSCIRQGEKSHELRVAGVSSELSTIVENQISQMRDFAIDAGLSHDFVGAREAAIRLYYSKLTNVYCCA